MFRNLGCNKDSVYVFIHSFLHFIYFLPKLTDWLIRSAILCGSCVPPTRLGKAVNAHNRISRLLKHSNKTPLSCFVLHVQTLRLVSGIKERNLETHKEEQNRHRMLCFRLPEAWTQALVM